VLVPNASEAERQALPGGGARVALSWEPEHMHLVRDSGGETEDFGAEEASEPREVALGTTGKGE